jgi:hypothetical protein
MRVGISGFRRSAHAAAPPRLCHDRSRCRELHARREILILGVVLRSPLSVAPWCQTLLVRFANKSNHSTTPSFDISRPQSPADLVASGNRGPGLKLGSPPGGDVRVSGRANTPSWVYRRRADSGTPPAALRQLALTHSLTHQLGIPETGRLWNTTSCLTAVALTHSLPHPPAGYTGDGPTLEHHQLPYGSSHSLTQLPTSWVYRRRADSGTPPAALRRLHSLTHSHAQLGIPETAHRPTLEYPQLPHGSSTHSPTHQLGIPETGRLWNTTSCLTASPLTHSLTQSARVFGARTSPSPCGRRCRTSGRAPPRTTAP